MHEFTLENLQLALYLVLRGQQNEDTGDNYFDKGEYQKAIECFSKALEIAQEIGYKTAMGNVFASMGTAYFRKFENQRAIDCFRKHLEIAKELGHRKGLRIAFENMGRAFQSNGQYQMAIEYNSKFLELADEIGDRKGMGTAFGNMGIAYQCMGQYETATDCHRKQLKIAKEIGDRRAEGNALGNTGNAYYKTGQYQKAIDCHRKVLEIMEEIGDRRGVGRAFGNLGSAYHSSGLYQKAIDCHQKLLEIAEENGDIVGVGTAFGNMGNVYDHIGQHQMAITCRLKYIQIAKKIGDKRGEGATLGNMGTAYHKMGQYQKAIDCIREHLEIAEKIGDKEGVATAFGNLGNLHWSIDEYEKAIDCHRKMLEVAQQIGDKGGIGMAFGNMGNVYDSIGQYEKAVNCYRNYLKIAEEIGDIRGVATAQSSLGLCYRQKDVTAACSFFAKSILSFQIIRDSLTHKDEYNTSMANTFAAVHKFLFENLLNLRQVKAALLVSDSGKAKALNDLTRSVVGVAMDTDSHDKNLLHAISDDPASKTTEALFNETLVKVLQLMQDGSIISYAFGERGNLHAWVISKAGVFHKQWETANGLSAITYLKTINAQLRESLVRTVPKNSNSRADIQTLQQNKAEQFTELAFTVSKEKKKNNFTTDLEKRLENLTRFVDIGEVMKRKREALSMKRVKERYSLDCPKKSSEESRKDDETCIGRYSLDIPNIIHSPKRTSDMNQTRNPTEDKDNATVNYLRKKYSIFISPVEEYLIGSKILIVPEGSLFTKLYPFCTFLNSKNEHLCDRYSLQFTPALHVLNASLSKPLPEHKAALFVGNPKVGVVKFGDNPQRILPLPNAAIEANECSKYFNAEPLLEENATKENVLKNMKDASIIHIAAHGHEDHADIFLAPNKGAPNPPDEEHYLLTAKDVLDCTLKARLVVLSCCHSGRGQISAEGVIGIARSFLGAGARSVLVTLWQVRDKPTMELMKMFYERVCQGLSVCVALQKAMIKLKETYAIQAWAPFQIFGEDIELTKEDIEEIRRQSSLR